jgi:hypothetical protein
MQTVGIHRLMDKYGVPTLTGAESRVKWLCEKYQEAQDEKFLGGVQEGTETVSTNSSDSISVSDVSGVVAITDEQEAQDGTSNNGLDIDSSEGREHVDGDTVGVVDTDSVDAIIEEMRKQIGFKFHPNFDAIRQCRLVVDEFVRPHIEKLVGELDRRTNALQNRIGLDTDLLRQRDDAIKRAEKAEAVYAEFIANANRRVNDTRAIGRD